MKYIITENRLVDFVDKYLEDSVGRLRVSPLTHINAREGDFELVKDNGETIFTYGDYHLGVEEHLFYKMMSLFNLEKSLNFLLITFILKVKPNFFICS